MSAGQNLPDFSARYIKIAPDSNSVKGLPPGPSVSMIEGILLLGLIARYSGLN